MRLRWRYSRNGVSGKPGAVQFLVTGVPCPDCACPAWLASTATDQQRRWFGRLFTPAPALVRRLRQHHHQRAVGPGERGDLPAAVSAILLLSNGIPVAAVVQSTEGAHVGMSRFTMRGPTLKSIRICQPRLRSFTFPTHSSRRLPCPCPAGASKANNRSPNQCAARHAG
jgi:hypothetical protein